MGLEPGNEALYNGNSLYTSDVTSSRGFKLPNACSVELPVMLLMVMNENGVEQQLLTREH